MSTRTSQQQSAFIQLRSSSRFLFFAAVMLLPAGTIGATSVAKLQYATAIMGNESGIGLLALIAAVGGAIMGLPAGTLVDRFSPRAILLSVLFSMSIVNLGTGLLLIHFTPHFSVFVFLAFIEGLVIALSVPALAAMQAALVPHDSRGAAEIVNLLRLAVGGIVGTIIAARMNAPATVLIGSAVILAIVFIWVSVITRAVVFQNRDVEPIAVSAVVELFTRVRAMPILRQTIIADLVLRFVIPTQLVNLFIVDKGADEFAALFILGGVFGVFAGNFGLAITGLRGRLDRRIRLTFVLYAAIIGVGSLLMIRGYLISHPALLVTLVIIGSCLGTFVQGMLAAIVQQRSPDDIRGRLTGGLAGARMLLVAFGVVLGTVITQEYVTEVFSWVLFALAIASLLLLRGFTGVGESVEQ